MRKLVVVLLAGLAVGGGWLAYRNLDANIARDEQGRLREITLRPRPDSWIPLGDGTSDTHGDSGAGRDAPAPADRPTVRIATYHATGLDTKRLANKAVAEAMVQTLRQFDLVALQDIGGTSPATMISLVELIRQAGGQYDFAVCPIAREQERRPYQAFLFNRASIEVDRDTVRSVDDPEDRFRHDPLVGLFRVRGPEPDEAFTFRLIGIQTDPAHAQQELSLLPGLYRAARDDGLGEDDVIMLGDFVGTAPRIRQLLGATTLSLALADGAVTSRGTPLPDNLLLSRRATAEFTGRSGAFDLRGQFALNTEVAHRIATHLPVWAEFSSIEGGAPGFVAGRVRPQTRR